MKKYVVLYTSHIEATEHMARTFPEEHSRKIPGV
jgi:hypothetical protein